MLLFLFAYQNNTAEVLLYDVAFIYKIKDVHDKVMSLLKDKNIYKGIFFMMSSFLFEYIKQ